MYLTLSIIMMHPQTMTVLSDCLLHDEPTNKMEDVEPDNGSKKNLLRTDTSLPEGNDQSSSLPWITATSPPGGMFTLQGVPRSAKIPVR